MCRGAKECRLWTYLPSSLFLIIQTNTLSLFMRTTPQMLSGRDNPKVCGISTIYLIKSTKTCKSHIYLGGISEVVGCSQEEVVTPVFSPNVVRRHVHLMLFEAFRTLIYYVVLALYSAHCVWYDITTFRFFYSPNFSKLCIYSPPVCLSEHSCFMPCLTYFTDISVLRHLSN